MTRDTRRSPWLPQPFPLVLLAWKLLKGKSEQEGGREFGGEAIERSCWHWAQQLGCGGGSFVVFHFGKDDFPRWSISTPSHPNTSGGTNWVVFRGLSTFSGGVWMSRERLFEMLEVSTAHFRLERWSHTMNL